VQGWKKKKGWGGKRNTGLGPPKNPENVKLRGIKKKIEGVGKGKILEPLAVFCKR